MKLSCYDNAYPYVLYLRIHYSETNLFSYIINEMSYNSQHNEYCCQCNL